MAKSGRLIVRLASDNVRPGELLLDESGKKVGKVIELIGPVRAPYASVAPLTDRTSKVVGAKIFSGGFVRDRGQGRGFARGRGKGRGRK